VKLHPKELQPYLKNRRITTGTTLTSVAFDSLMHLDADVPFLDSPAKKSKLLWSQIRQIRQICCRRFQPENHWSVFKGGLAETLSRVATFFLVQQTKEGKIVPNIKYTKIYSYITKTTSRIVFMYKCRLSTV
jgi:hypothetical protein